MYLIGNLIDKTQYFQLDTRLKKSAVMRNHSGETFDIAVTVPLNGTTA